jgi:hypothetical protein
MTRLPHLILCAGLLAACAPPPPTEPLSRGTGFDTPTAREAALNRPTPTPADMAGFPGAVMLPPGTVLPSEAEDIAARTRAALGQPPASVPVIGPSGVVGSVPQPDFAGNPGASGSAAIPRSTSPLDTQPATRPVPAPLPGDGVVTARSPAPAPDGTVVAAADLDRDNPNISTEQDFAAVSQQRDIEADAARLEAARAQYQVVAPTELQRPEDGGPNIIAYAVNEAQPRGAAGSFSRGPLATVRRAEQRCRNYRTADAAQAEFLAAGGPQRDRLGLDPDGDGNACAWDPAAYVDLVRGGQ